MKKSYECICPNCGKVVDDFDNCDYDIDRVSSNRVEILYPQHCNCGHDYYYVEIFEFKDIDFYEF